jgi:glycosyltransferase involved in cell wall biosynthesis
MVSVARPSYSKGVDVLLHAWARMLRAPADWRAGLTPVLQVVGDGPLKSQMERIAGELGIMDSVEFLGWRTDIVDLLQQAWGFVLPSRWEGMPGALLEAMACGLPCIATRVSGSEDIICNGVDGLLVEPEQPAELADALRRVIQDTELARRLGREGRSKVVRSYQLRHVVEQCVALYRCLLAQDRGAMVSAAQRIGADE